MALTFRAFRDEDLPGVLRLWEAESGWGAIDAATWKQWHLGTPFGDSIVSVAEDETGEIVGQEVFTPAHILMDGQPAKALHLSAPIVSQAWRDASMRHPGHPVIGLYKAAAEAAAKRGYRCIYAMPKHAWLPIFKWLPRVGIHFETTEYPCLSLAVREPSTQRHAVCVQPGTIGAEHEALWRTVHPTIPAPCCVERTERWLRWRNGAHQVLEARAGGDDVLRGFVTIRKNDGLVMDLVARYPDGMTSTLSAACQWLASNPKAIEPSEVKLMATPIMRDVAAPLRPEPVDFTFAFVSTALVPEEVPTHTIHPDRWHAMPGD